MARHKLVSSSTLIQSLINLGSALGYKAHGEYPAARPARRGLDVDVAWLRDDNQRFPLMIFEIESAVTNSAANNPVKVFGQSNERYEKPLFFFHIFVKGGGNTARIDTLKSLFGSYNYRAYCLENGDSKQLLLDIMSQHRRLTKELDFEELFEALEDISEFSLLADELFFHLEKCNFGVDFVVEYARLAVRHPQNSSHFLRRLEENYNFPSEANDSHSYETYIGEEWRKPIELGILYQAEIGDPKIWVKALIDWQKGSYGLTQIGPHFGLGYDYDQFLIGLSPPLCTFITGLFQGDSTIPCHFGGLLTEILNNLVPSSKSVFNALWLLYLAASIPDETIFEVARQHINKIGGINKDWLKHPPSTIYLEGETEWDETWNTAAVQVGNLNVFMATHCQPKSQISGVQLGIELLTDDIAFLNWSDSIISLLFGWPL